MQWADITITDGTRNYTGDRARDHLIDRHPGLVADRTSKSISLLLQGKSVHANEAVKSHLEALLGPRLKYNTRSVHDFVAPPTRSVQRRQPNVLAPQRPKLVVTLELGDIDGLFDPIGAGPTSKDKGVRQRLQALGYFYAPMNLPRTERLDQWAADAWSYFTRVHQAKSTAQLSDGELKDLLKREIAAHLVAAAFPNSGQVLPMSRLPCSGESAAIRVPGGYRCTFSGLGKMFAGDHVYNNGIATVNKGYEFKIGSQRHKLESLVYSENPLLGRLPLVVKVTRQVGSGPPVPIDGAKVIVQLVDPDLDTRSAFEAPPAPDRVMNYGVDARMWTSNSRPPVMPDESKSEDLAEGLLAAEYEALHKLVVAADAQSRIDAIDAWIDAWAPPPAPTPLPSPSPTPSASPPMPTSTPMPTTPPGSTSTPMPGSTSTPPPMPTSTLPPTPPGSTSPPPPGPVLAPPPMGMRAAPTWRRQQQAPPTPAPAADWAAVQDWWGDPSDTPYTGLRSEMVAPAKRVAARILAAKQPPELTDVGQRRFLADMLDRLEAAAGPTDPQRRNVPERWCGKASAADGIKAVLDVPTRDVDGFHARRPTQTADHGAIVRATLPDDAGKYPHAVQCLTNARGVGGTIFKPSRCGGDRYRLRVTLDETWLASQHASPDSETSVESGTLIVWRNLRLHKHVKVEHKRPPSSSTADDGEWSAELVALATAGDATRFDNSLFLGMNLRADMVDAAILPSTPREPPYPATSRPRPDHSKVALAEQWRPAATSSASFADQLRWAYCEVIQDCARVETLRPDELHAALDVGAQSFEASRLLKRRVHWPTMFLKDPTSPFLVTMRSLADYSRRKPSTHERLTDAESDGDYTEPGWVLVAGVIESLSDGGLMPGLTFIQAAWGTTWHDRFHAGISQDLITSGFGGTGGAMLSCTRGTYYPNFIYPATANGIHELGHVLMLSHQEWGASGDVHVHQEAPAAKLATPASDAVVCVMSYGGCYGELCGRCLLSLRGWAVKSKKLLTGA